MIPPDADEGVKRKGRLSAALPPCQCQLPTPHSQPPNSRAVWQLGVGGWEFTREAQKSKAQLTFSSRALRISVGRSQAVVGRT